MTFEQFSQQNTLLLEQLDEVQKQFIEKKSEILKNLMDFVQANASFKIGDIVDVYQKSNGKYVTTCTVTNLITPAVHLKLLKEEPDIYRQVGYKLNRLMSGSPFADVWDGRDSKYEIKPHVNDEPTEPANTAN